MTRPRDLTGTIRCSTCWVEAVHESGPGTPLVLRHANNCPELLIEPDVLARVNLSADAPLRVGDILYGFCGGYFGRDHYGPARVEAIGADWVVARNIEATGVDVAFGPPDQLVRYRTPEVDA